MTLPMMTRPSFRFAAAPCAGRDAGGWRVREGASTTRVACDHDRGATRGQDEGRDDAGGQRRQQSRRAPAGLLPSSCACISSRPTPHSRAPSSSHSSTTIRRCWGRSSSAVTSTCSRRRERKTIDVVVSRETRFVGALAAFRDIRNAQWRGLVPGTARWSQRDDRAGPCRRLRRRGLRWPRGSTDTHVREQPSRLVRRPVPPAAAFPAAGPLSRALRRDHAVRRSIPHSWGFTEIEIERDFLQHRQVRAASRRGRVSRRDAGTHAGRRSAAGSRSTSVRRRAIRSSIWPCRCVGRIRSTWIASRERRRTGAPRAEAVGGARRDVGAPETRRSSKSADCEAGFFWPAR